MTVDTARIEYLDDNDPADHAYTSTASSTVCERVVGWRHQGQDRAPIICGQPYPGHGPHARQRAVADQGSWYVDNVTLQYDHYGRNGLPNGLLPGVPVGVRADGRLFCTDAGSPAFVGYLEHIEPDGVGVVMLHAPTSQPGTGAVDSVARFIEALQTGRHSVEIEDMAATLQKGQAKHTVKCYSTISVQDAGEQAQREYVRLHGMVVLDAIEYGALVRDAQAWRASQGGGDGPMVA